MIGRGRSGGALVLCLVMMVLMTIIILTAFTVVDLSGRLSKSRLDGFRASLMAREGVEAAVASLQVGTSASVWASAPGLLTVTRTPGANEESITLHSGFLSGTNGINLNTGLFSAQNEGSIATDTANKMTVDWIYARADGSKGTDTSYNATNQIVGRYAYWVDDESSKINLNTAWSRTSIQNDAAKSHPTRIRLAGSFDGATDEIVNSTRLLRQTNAFNSNLDFLKMLKTSPEAITGFKESKFDFTYYNNSPDGDLTYFGKPKIVLTTKAERAGGRPYLDISTGAKINETISRLVDYMSRDDWPMAPGETFQDKFYSNSPVTPKKKGLAQLACNIIDYVRAREEVDVYPDTQQGMLPPLRGSRGTSGAANPSGNTYDDFCGVNRGLKIVQLGAWRNRDDLKKGILYATLYLPKYYGIKEVDLTKLRRRIMDVEVATTAQYYANGHTPITAGTVSNSVLKAGQFVRLAIPIYLFPNAGIDYLLERTGPKISRRLEILFRFPTVWSANDYIAVADVPFQNTGIQIPIKSSPPAVAGGNAPLDSLSIGTIVIDDPVVGGTEGSWRESTSTIADMAGPPPDNSVFPTGKPAANAALEQDVDSSGKLTDEGMVMPAPFVPNNPDLGNKSGMVESLAELGHIHTGIQPPPSGSYGSYLPIKGLTGLNTGVVHWRTLRLQPRNPGVSNSAKLPDWALLDLFALPLDPNAKTGGVQAKILRPTANAVSGKMNINGAVRPFSTTDKRVIPYEALFGDLASMPNATDQKTAATNIADFKLAETSVAKGRMFGTNNVFQFPGQLVEIAGVADKGENSEAVLTEVLDLVSTKGNVFAVYSVGQSLIQSPEGKFNIRGEQRRTDVLERVDTRVFKPDGTAESGNVSFRNIFSKSMDL